MAIARRRSAAFTLVELLVVITILGVLMSLLLPAVNSVRESMRRTQCKNNLAQCGRAAQEHVTAQGFFPGGGWGYMWVGDPNHGFGARQPGGWIYNILPYAGLDMIHDIGKGLTGDGSGPKYNALAEAKTAAIPFLICPTRRKVIAYPTNQTSYNSAQPALLSKTDYAANGGSNHFEGTGPQLGDNCYTKFPNCPWSNPDQSSFNGVEGERSEVRPGLITDGLSNVFFAGEKYLDAAQYYTGQDPADDNCVLQGNDRDTNRWVMYGSTAQPPLRDVKGNQQEFCFGSAQPAGVNLVLCDGHAQLISYQINSSSTIPYGTFQILGIRNALTTITGATLSDNY